MRPGCGPSRGPCGHSCGPSTLNVVEVTHKSLILLVGAGRFERPTPCAQGRCATRLRYAPTCGALLILNHFLNLRYVRPWKNRDKTSFCNALALHLQLQLRVLLEHDVIGLPTRRLRLLRSGQITDRPIARERGIATTCTRRTQGQAAPARSLIRPKHEKAARTWSPFETKKTLQASPGWRE
jgi:hypothetical protein